MNENNERRRKLNVLFISWKLLLWFPVSHWQKFDDSVQDLAYDWLALCPPHHSDNLSVNNTATGL